LSKAASALGHVKCSTQIIASFYSKPSSAHYLINAQLIKIIVV